MTTKILIAVGLAIVLGVGGAMFWKMQPSNTDSTNNPTEGQPAVTEPTMQPANPEQPATTTPQVAAGFKVKIEYCTS